VLKIVGGEGTVREKESTRNGSHDLYLITSTVHDPMEEKIYRREASPKRLKDEKRGDKEGRNAQS